MLVPHVNQLLQVLTLTKALPYESFLALFLFSSLTIKACYDSYLFTVASLSFLPAFKNDHQNDT